MKIKPTYMIFFQDLHYRIDNQNCFETVRSLNNQIRYSPVRYFWQCKYIYESKSDNNGKMKSPLAQINWKK